MNTNLDLTKWERQVLDTIEPEWTHLRDLSEQAREAVDYLVLSGLIERNRDNAYSGDWLDEWRLTEAARALTNLLELRENGDLLDRPGEA
jgi:hypothetical protein